MCPAWSEADVTSIPGQSPPRGLPAKRALVIDVAGSCRDATAWILGCAGFTVEAVGSPEAALQLARVWHPHLVLLASATLAEAGADLGQRLCEAVVGPILLLPSVQEDEDVLSRLGSDFDSDLKLLQGVHSLLLRVRGLDQASPEELTARGTIRAGPILVDQARRTVTVRAQEVFFRRKEYDLLLALLSPPGQVVGRDELMARVWGDRPHIGTKTLHVHVRRVRQKIELDMRNPEVIITIRGVGFYFKPDDSSPHLS